MEEIEYYYFKTNADKLKNPKKSLPERYGAMMYLLEHESLDAIDALIKAFRKEQSSDLLRHEICYCIGQMGKSPEHIQKIQKFFEEEINKPHTKFVRHELVESMGNLSEENTIALLDRFKGEDDDDKILYESCYLMRCLIEWRKTTENGKTEGLDMNSLKTESLNPSPPFNYLEDKKYGDVNYLREILLDNENYDLFHRYRAIFTLREICTEEAVEAMC
jgi:deoxyhypusine monooxygenase